MENNDAVKLFISYSWSSPEHENWVLDLATHLVDNAVEVILDKWDLKEGDDTIKFMETMVNDPGIRKVIIVSDKAYTEKANARNGGVGTETQIISKEIYEGQSSGKFVAVVAEKNNEGKAYLPTYYKSRIYIDLSEPHIYGKNFDQLLRWIYDKPLFIKPEQGKKPAFLNEGSTINLGTTTFQRRVLNSVIEGRLNSKGYLSEYLELLRDNISKIRITAYNREPDEPIIESIDAFNPYKDEYVHIILTLAKYGIDEDHMKLLHRFFESSIPYMYPMLGFPQIYAMDFDAFKFILHELFLYTIAILIKYEKFDKANYLLDSNYFISTQINYIEEELVPYTIFRQYMESMNHRDRRMGLNRLSLRSDILKKRSESSGLDFRFIMQADFVLYMRSELSSGKKRWFPETLVYLGIRSGVSFEIFAKSQSLNYFEKVKCLLNIDSKDSLLNWLKKYQSGELNVPSWDFETFNPAGLLGINKLATER